MKHLHHEGGGSSQMNTLEIPNGYHKEIQLDNLRVIARGHWVGIVVPADLLRKQQPSCLELAASTVNMIPGCAFQDLC